MSDEGAVANIVPKRAFSPEGLAQLRALLQAHVAPKRVLGAKKLFLAWLALVVLFTVLWQVLAVTARH